MPSHVVLSLPLNEFYKIFGNLINVKMWCTQKPFQFVIFSYPYRIFHFICFVSQCKSVAIPCIVVQSNGIGPLHECVAVYFAKNRIQTWCEDDKKMVRENAAS